MASPIDGSGKDCQHIPSSTDTDVNILLEVLADPQRRNIMEYLAATTERTVTSEEIVEYLAGGASDRVEADPELAEIECHHKHLPKLSDTGLIEYDPLVGDVRYNRQNAVERLLDTINEIENYL